MGLGIRGRLFVVSLAFVAIAGLIVGIVVDRQLRGVLHDRITAELSRHAHAARDALELSRLGGGIDVVDPVAARLGASMDARLTVIAADGTVLGDSAVPTPEVGNMENHADRPEVVDAVAEGTGTSTRFSATLSKEMTYVAVRKGNDGAVVRVGLTTDEIAASVAQLRTILLLTGLVALLAAAALAALMSELLSRSLRSLVGTAKAIASNTSDMARIPEQPNDDLRRLAGSFNVIVGDLEAAVATLASERNRFETALDTMEQAVVALDGNREVTMVNRRAREMLTLPDKAVGRPLLDYVRVPELRDLVASAEASGSAHAEFEYGTVPRLSVRAQASVQREGGTVIVLHDMTEIRRLERIRKDFVANVSHELRTPVAVIRANTETLLAGALDDKDRAKVFIEALHRHADRLGRLVADLLDISRIEAGRYTMNVVPVSLADVVDRTIDNLSTEADAHETAVKRVFEDDCWVAADDKALEQVLVNLVSNAIRYAVGGRLVEVALDVESPEQVRVEVRDEGPGIDPKHHKRVFERFYRVDTGRARDKGGTGLGLAIVKHLVEAMGGHVGVDGRRPRGAVFWFTLPRARAGEDQLPLALDERVVAP
ncbi:MAG: ATP-binding protein [Myxococcota bacterium]